MRRFWKLLVAAVIVMISALIFRGQKVHDEIARVTPYRFQALIRTDVDRDIAQLEERTRNQPQFVEYSMLASLYYSQSRLTGNLSWLEKATVAAHESLRLMPTANAAAKLTLAKIAESRHEFNDAVELAQSAHKEDPAKNSSLEVLATAYLAMGNLPEAGRQADQAVDRVPGLESYGLRALILTAQGRDDEAISDFERALEIEDIGEAQESARVRALFARFLMRHGDFVHARALLEEALKTIPDYHLAYDLLGDLEMLKGNYPQAEKHYRAAFESSRQLAYLVHLSRLKVQMGQTQEALEIQNQAEILLRSEIGKNGNGHRLDLASLLLDRGRAQDLPEALRLSVEDVHNRHSALALSVLAKAWTKLGKYVQARDTIRELLRLGVKDPEYYAQASLIEAGIKNLRQSNLYLSESRKQNGGSALALPH